MNNWKIKLNTINVINYMVTPMAMGEITFYDWIYRNSMLFIIIVIIVTGIMLLLAETLSLGITRNQAQLSEYECGFEPFDNATRAPFEVHFYVVGILFLIFDVEITLLYPWIFAISNNNMLTLFTGYFFIFILGLGLLYELKMNVLSWKQDPEIKRSIIQDFRNLELKNNYKVKLLPSPIYKEKPRRFNGALMIKPINVYGDQNHNTWWSPEKKTSPLSNKEPQPNIEVNCRVRKYIKNCTLKGEKINWNFCPTESECGCVLCQLSYQR